MREAKQRLMSIIPIRTKLSFEFRLHLRIGYSGSPAAAKTMYIFANLWRTPCGADTQSYLEKWTANNKGKKSLILSSEPSTAREGSRKIFALLSKRVSSFLLTRISAYMQFVQVLE